MRPANLTDKHRPKTLADCLGNAAHVRTLAEYADRPYPAAFLFSGPTGVGKTSAARALAADLGCHPTADLIEIDSGQCDMETLEWVKGQLRFVPLGPWRVIVVDEADLMTPKAEQYWLSILDDLPSRTTIVFTTNRPEWFAARQRLIDRLEHLPFAGDAASLATEAQALIDRVWLSETGRDDSPRLADLPAVVGEELSFRRVVAALAPLVREARGESEEPFALARSKPANPTIFGQIDRNRRETASAAARPRQPSEPVATVKAERIRAYLATLDPADPPSVRSVATACEVSRAFASKVMQSAGIPIVRKPRSESTAAVVATLPARQPLNPADWVYDRTAQIFRRATQPA